MQLVVGRIVRPHGVRGEVVVELHTDSPTERFAVGSVLATDPATAGPLTISEVRPLSVRADRGPGYQGRLLVLFEGYADRDVSERLRDVYLLVDSATLAAPTDPEEFHDYQLVGLSAQTTDGQEIGRIVRVEHAPAHDLLVVALPDGRQGMVPFVRALVPEVDLPGGRVVLTPPEGLFEL
jgi:16S rRNA processing protein RimM